MLNSVSSVKSRTLQHWYSAEFERRLAELTQVLNAQLEARVEEIRAHYAAQQKAPKHEESVQHNAWNKQGPFSMKSRAVRQVPRNSPQNLSGWFPMTTLLWVNCCK